MANALTGVKPKYESDNNRTIGAAQVTEIDGKVKISYLPKLDWKKNDGSTIEVKHPNGKVANIYEMNQVPVVLEPGFDEVLVVTSDEKDGITQFSPYEGQFKCKFVEFWRPNGEGTAPIWKESEPKTWADKKGGSKQYTTLDVRAYYEISTNPFFKGVKLVHFLRYLFTDNAGLASFSFELVSPSRAKQSKHGQKLLDALLASGALDSQIEWPEDGNILPELERRMQKANKTVMITVKDGWISDISAVSKLSDEAVEEVKPAVPASDDEM